MPNINKWRQVFLIETFTLFLTIKGRINFLQLQRFGKYSEQRYRQQFERKFDRRATPFLGFNKELVRQHSSGNLIIALDPSFLSKAGKKTPGLGYFWSGQAGSMKRGLEITGIAAIDIKNHTGFHLEAVQTIIQEGKTLTEHYAELIIQRKEALSGLSEIVVADAWFTKKPFVDAMRANEFHFVGRLRDDARLKYLYHGPRTGKRGRPKKYDGKVKPKMPDMNVFETLQALDDTTIHTAIVYSESLECDIRVVLMPISTGKTGYKIFFSTDTEMHAANLLQYYKSRFQIEFIYRDSKQHTGLNDCQARSENKLHFQTNAALTAVNIAKAKHWISLPEELRKAFSMNDIKTLNHNCLLLDKFFITFGVNPNLIKNQKYVKELIRYGTIAA